MLDRRSFFLSALFVPIVNVSCSPHKFGQTSPSNDAILTLLKEPIDVERASPGIITGVIDVQGRRLVPYGRFDATDRQALDGDTVFEIGSITKVFTALLLADMVARREVAMDDPVGKYLPADVHMPAYNGKVIKMVDVATYAPGLPGWPDNIERFDAEGPFPDYTVSQLYAALNGHKLEFAPGTHYVYSNFGFGLLGHVLARRAGVSFEELVVSRICTPLAMDSTRMTLTPSMRARLAPGHNGKLEQVGLWELPPTLAGAGAFASTANDMLTFLTACMGYKRTSLAPAMAGILDVRRHADAAEVSADVPEASAGTGWSVSTAGWFISTGHDDELVWKAGATKGYSTFIGYSTQSHVGTVVLANGQCSNIITALGKHLLNPDIPLAENKL
jgi:CubicO group peptidase (beta-lactamase class C family)